MEKGRVVIARSVNKIFGPCKINGSTLEMGLGLRAKRTGVDGPLAVDGLGVTRGIRAG